MRRLICVLMLGLLLLPVTAGAGDPLDTNDQPMSANVYCENVARGDDSPVAVWLCNATLAMDYGGWWDWGWDFRP